MMNGNKKIALKRDIYSYCFFLAIITYGKTIHLTIMGIP